MIFHTKKIYLKDASFEAPSTPGIFTQTGIKPAFDVQMFIDYQAIDEKSGLTEIILKITATSRHEENTLYLAEVHQAGLFEIQHPDPDTHQMIIQVTCPHILLPFAREELNGLISKGGFSNFLIAPVNFEALYQSRKNGEKDKVTDTEAPKSMN